MGSGDVVVIEPGHDAWVVGDESCVFLDTGIAAYAKPALGVAPHAAALVARQGEDISSACDEKSSR